MYRVALFIAAAALASLSASATCPLSSFGAAKRDTCGRHACRIKTPPEDVERIVRGAYFEYVDLMPGNVRYWWTAIDLDKSELIAVERYPATMIRRLVDLRKKETHPQRTAIRRPDADHVDWVQRHPVPREKAADVVCLANRLWNSGDDAQVDYVTDAHSSLFLVDTAASRRFAGLGIPTGDAKKLEALLDSLAPRDWVAWAPLAPPTASATCPLSSFGAGKRKTCRRAACLVNKTPADIGRIRRGAYVEAVSLDLFTRLSSWVGVDIDKAEIVTVERYPASAWNGLSEMRKQKDPKRIVLQRPDKDSVDVVRRYPVPPEKVGELVCSANKLWSAGDAKMIDETTGGYTALFVVDAGSARRFDGLGILRGDAKALGELMESLKDPEWTWYVPVN